MFPDSPEIKKSYNYDQFKMIEWNRSLDNGNLRKLLEENRKEFKLHQFPILVTKDMKVIDGQHRLKISKEIGSPVYYIITNADDSFKSVHSVNKAGKKHTIKDKLEMLNRSGDEGARMIYKTFNLYQGKFEASTIAQLLVSGTTGGHIKEGIDNDGQIILRNYEGGLEVLDAIHYMSTIPNKYKARIVFALSLIFKRTGLHPKKILERIEVNRIKWLDPKSTQEAVRMMLNCYNYGLTVKGRLSLEKK